MTEKIDSRLRGNDIDNIFFIINIKITTKLIDQLTNSPISQLKININLPIEQLKKTVSSTEYIANS